METKRENDIFENREEKELKLYIEQINNCRILMFEFEIMSKSIYIFRQ